MTLTETDSVQGKILPIHSTDGMTSVSNGKKVDSLSKYVTEFINEISLFANTT